MLMSPAFLSLYGAMFSAVGLEPSYPLRLLAIEFPLLSPAPGCALHLLLTLSDRFSIALCTNPPRPLVGELGRSKRSGEILPCDGDIASVRPADKTSPSREDLISGDGGSNRWLLKIGRGERTRLADETAEFEYRWLPPEMPFIDPSLDVEIERTLSGGGLSSFSGSNEVSLDMPGKRTLLVADAVSDISSS